jgi:hypothetical protein
MKTAFKLTLLAWVCVGMSSEAHAQYNLRTVPATPVAGQPFQVVFEDTECEEFLLSSPGAPPSVTVQGTTVTVAADRIEVIGCSSPATTYSITAPALAQGAYTLELLARVMGEPGNEVVEASVPLQIAGAVASAPTSIPTTDSAARVLLAMLLAAIAMLEWRSRR